MDIIEFLFDRVLRWVSLGNGFERWYFLLVGFRGCFWESFLRYYGVMLVEVEE